MAVCPCHVTQGPQREPHIWGRYDWVWRLSAAFPEGRAQSTLLAMASEKQREEKKRK
jgi:hypothetical protein